MRRTAGLFLGLTTGVEGLRTLETALLSVAALYTWQERMQEKRSNSFSTKYGRGSRRALQNL